ncbi:MAG: hypothetical protein BKP49_03950 [Treponema sp. CETP13]|nr:MAG: hypothetical protein BKP49_03950 [Treponema sp. CETP13]
MKKLPIVLFILIALFILFFAIFFHIHPQTKETITAAKTVIPITPGSETVQEEEQEVPEENIDFSSLIPLEENETLLATYSIDFDKDGYEDQIISVKDTNSQFIKVILGLYNQVYASFDRSIILQTNIDQVQSFSFYVQDITATHTNTLILSGFDSENNAVLKVYMPSRTSDSLELDCVLDLVADGSIFVQQLSQNSSYDLGQTDGASFPIWVYKSDDTAPEGSLDQLQIEYVWNKNKYLYEQSKITKITAKSITAQELRKIQDGTVSTFANFLNGLWKKSSSSESELRYISFDYPGLMINFASQGTQEIYNWNESKLRRNGIMLLLSNSEIPNLIRRFDISLVSTNEINVKIADNLGMTIGANPLWDGNYKKVVTRTIEKTNNSKINTKNEAIDTLLITNNTNWISDTNYKIDFTQTKYTATPITDEDTTANSSIETGGVSRLTVNGNEFLELRSSIPDSNFTGIYKVTTLSKVGENATSIQINLIPVKVKTDIIEEINSKPLVLSQTIQNTKSTKE